MEVHDEKELERAMKIDADIIGVNNRNLKDFTISRYDGTAFRNWYRKTKFWLRRVVSYRMRMWNFLKECGVDAFLIGRALMEAGASGRRRLQRGGKHKQKVPQIKICGSRRMRKYNG